jgi:hypothetical protein
MHCTRDCDLLLTSLVFHGQAYLICSDMRL